MGARRQGGRKGVKKKRAPGEAKRARRTPGQLGRDFRRQRRPNEREIRWYRHQWLTGHVFNKVLFSDYANLGAGAGAGAGTRAEREMTAGTGCSDDVTRLSEKSNHKSMLFIFSFSFLLFNWFFWGGKEENYCQYFKLVQESINDPGELFPRFNQSLKSNMQMRAQLSE